MIDFLRGLISHVESEYVVLDVRDVGYRVFTPNPYAFAGKEDAVTIYIHHHVREDAILLYGFESREEQTLFRKLLEVSGIGPRVALGILAGGRPDAVIGAIQQENIAFLTRLPGIGKKTAQRMILDLKDKLAGFATDAGLLAAAGLAPHQPVSAASAQQGAGTAWEEARDGLSALGYTAAELDKAWSALAPSVTADETVDSLMKRALQQLFKG
ncbi:MULTISPECIES: Holliday junction branch migration protein RuvA [Paenibacillus]|uniref:Holliday junction branch migration complex subunit RuvA n=1 Tax=Paenibacillus glycanilyticus TaxID=126569 RepID=A0ABQ6NR21_9BACL|nr:MULTISPECIES: Holliday junction branch migration protein RuvA [Paenibacillus]MCK9859186.1 Holliday junction branch migration protein RuvA [Paenibacillus sp. ATY16]GMK47238.1 Holliday junction ATP-dependent DNA helicase RuvA [Paenibacillus glycanilyticus]